MMKWRGQGILTAVVLIAAGAYAIQWRTVIRLTDSIEGHGLSIAPYARSVSEFVDHMHRWPAINEVTLVAPPAGGPIRKVTLGEHGTLHFTYSGWTLRGWVIATFAPRVMSSPALEPGLRLTYECVAVKPSSMAYVICKQPVPGSLEEIEAGHVQEFAEWQNELERVEKRQAAITAAENTETECDRIVHRADQVSECVTRIDSGLGDRLATIVSTQFRNRPRLRADIVAESPDLLDKYNSQCTEDWTRLVDRLTAANHEVANCLPEDR